MRVLLLSLAACAALASSAARAADMPAGPPVVAGPQANLCGVFNGRHVDKTWRPGQVAYIVAGTCDPGGKLVHDTLTGLKAFLHPFLGIPMRENVLVYYNGGSAWRTDITSINTPYQPQLH
jgi:hypothetical protein